MRRPTAARLSATRREARLQPTKTLPFGSRLTKCSEIHLLSVKEPMFDAKHPALLSLPSLPAGMIPVGPSH